MAVKNALGHIGMGLLLMALFGLVAFAITRNVALSAWIGWAMQSAYWLGRERRDHEILHPEVAHGFAALRGWNLLNWSFDGRRDLLAPVLALAPLAWACGHVS